MGDARGWRAELITRVPWVTRLEPAERCDQHRWSAMSLKAAHDPELKKRYRCKNPAHWKFAGLKLKDNSDGLDYMFVGKSGVYCYAHLVNQAFIPEREWARWKKWCDENRALVERIKSGAEPKMIKRVRRNAAYDLSDEA